jgi:hypothetical protein
MTRSNSNPRTNELCLENEKKKESFGDLSLSSRVTSEAEGATRSNTPHVFANHAHTHCLPDADSKNYLTLFLLTLDSIRHG